MTGTIAEEAVINWAKNTLAMLAEIHDPERIIRICRNEGCGCEVMDYVGRHSKQRLLRHTRGGCHPNGAWVVKE